MLLAQQGGLVKVHLAVKENDQSSILSKVMSTHLFGSYIFWARKSPVFSISHRIILTIQIV